MTDFISAARPWRRAVAALFLAAAAPAALGAQASKAPQTPPDHVNATFVGAVHGALPPASCGGTQRGQQPGTAVIASFDETTSAQAGPGSGTFEMMVASTCAAPYYQALFANEPITARFTFVDGATGQTTLTLSLANARLTHVDLVQVSPMTGVGGAVLKIGITSAQVSTGSAGTSTASTGTGSAPAAPTGVTVSTPPGGTVQLSATVMKRLRAPSVHVASTVLTTMTLGAGETWSVGGVTANAHLTTSSPAMDAAFTDLSLFSLSVHALLDAVTGMPSTHFQIALNPLTKAQDAKTTQIKAAALAHAPLTQAVVTFTGRGGTGLTLWLKSAYLTADQVSSLNESISISASQMMITDIGSGRTSSFP